MLPNAAVAVIPEEYYRKPRGVQFKKSFRKRADAVRYAHRHGFRLVIACEADGCYDVMCGRGPGPGPKVSFELVEDRGELVAVPRSLTATRQRRAENRMPRKTPWKLAIEWLRTHWPEPVRIEAPMNYVMAIMQHASDGARD